MSKRILVLVEGKRDEIVLLDKLIGTYISQMKGDIEIFSYETNIYELYWRLNEKKYIDTIDYLNVYKKAKIPDTIKEIYLVFDLDIHHTSKNRKIEYKKSKILKLFDFFSDEFDKGYLYLNYPMYESYKDIRCYNRDIYINSYIDRNRSRYYKRTVDSRAGKLIKCAKEINTNLLNYLIYVNIVKANYILTGIRDKPENLINQKELFIQIASNYISKNRVPILNCLLFFPVIYFNQEDRNKFYNNLE